MQENRSLNEWCSFKDFFEDTFGNTAFKNSQKKKEADNSKVKLTPSDSNVEIKSIPPKTATIESYQPKAIVGDKLKAFVFKRRAETKSEAVTKTVEGLESLPKRIHEDGNNKLVKTKDITKLECESNVVKHKADTFEGSSKLGETGVEFELKKPQIFNADFQSINQPLETSKDDNTVRFESKKRQIFETANILPKKICTSSNFNLTTRAEIDSSKKLVQNRSISEIAQINLSPKESEKTCVKVERPFEFMDDDDLDLDTIFNNPNFKEQTKSEGSQSFEKNQSKNIEKQNFTSKKQPEFQSLETMVLKEKHNFNFKKPPELQTSSKPIYNKEEIVLRTNEKESRFVFGLKPKLTESTTTSKNTLIAAQSEARLKRLSVIKKLSKSPRPVRKFPGPAGLLPERKDLGQHTFLSSGAGDKHDKLETVSIKKTQPKYNLVNNAIFLQTQVIPCSQSTVNIFEEGPWMRMTDDFQVRDDIAVFLPGKYTVEWIKRTASDEKLINQKAPFLAAIVHKLEIVDVRLPVVSVFLKDMTGTFITNCSGYKSFGKPIF